MTADSLLEVRDLGVGFPGVGPVVNGVSFDLGPGETVGLVGESGSGKSMSCYALTGLTPPGARVSGNATLSGNPLIGATARALRLIRRKQIGMVFQDPVTALNPTLTIGDQISEPLRLFRGVSRRAARARAIALLDEVGIANAPGRIDDYPHAFSGGMCQRVMIAMALVMEPALLIADEPTSALDVQTQARILDLLATIQRDRGLGMLFVSHDLGVVGAIADRVLVMEHGSVVEQGAAMQVLGEPSAVYTRELVAAIPRGPKAKPAEQEARAGEPLLSVQNLDVRFAGGTGHGVHAVRDASLEVRRGEVVGLVGESGSGKTTLARCLVGLNRPSIGEIVWDGERIASRHTSKHIQMVFQDPFGSLNPRMTIQQIVAEPLLLHGIVDSRRTARERVAELLNEVGLDGALSERFPHQFSGGQRQRIAIARALASEPQLLVADEMVSALDVTVQSTILSLLLDVVARRGLAVLFISHDIAVVRKVSDRIIVMKDGVLVESGDTETVIAGPTDSYTRALIQLAGHA